MTFALVTAAVCAFIAVSLDGPGRLGRPSRWGWSLFALGSLLATLAAYSWGR